MRRRYAIRPEVMALEYRGLPNSLGEWLTISLLLPNSLLADPLSPTRALEATQESQSEMMKQEATIGGLAPSGNDKLSTSPALPPRSKPVGNTGTSAKPISAASSGEAWDKRGRGAEQDPFSLRLLLPFPNQGSLGTVGERVSWSEEGGRGSLQPLIASGLIGGNEARDKNHPAISNEPAVGRSPANVTTLPPKVLQNRNSRSSTRAGSGGGQSGSGAGHRNSTLSPMADPSPTLSLNFSTTSIPLNADDDNGSAITNGIPATRDFNATNLPQVDPELKAATITNTYPSGGMYTLDWSADSDAGISFWADQQKKQPITPGLQPETLSNYYVEGDQPSSAQGDVLVFLTYWYGYENTESVETIVNLTVTPIVNSFTLTPGGGANGQNIVFVNGRDGTDGVQAATPGGGPGISFAANLTITSMPGQPVFVQNVLRIDNGYNETQYNGQPVAVLYTEGNTPPAENLVVMAPLPVLDTDSGSQIPDYQAGVM